MTETSASTSRPDGAPRLTRARLLQAFGVLDDLVKPPPCVAVMRQRMLGELLGDAERVASTLDPSFELVMYAGDSASTLGGSSVVEAVRRSRSAGTMTWVEISTMVANHDTFAFHGSLGSLQTGSGVATTTPLAVFAHFSGERMTRETLFLMASQAAGIGCATDLPTFEELLLELG